MLSYSQRARLVLGFSPTKVYNATIPYQISLREDQSFLMLAPTLPTKVLQYNWAQIMDIRSTQPRFTLDALKANQALIKLLGSIAERKKATPAQIAFARLLAQKPWIVPIPGTTKLHRLEENIGAFSVELTPDDLRDIDTAASKVTVQGLDTRKNWSK
jgi:aryl-alcohol dehydrogenase-like predicted oxidoreductase